MPASGRHRAGLSTHIDDDPPERPVGLHDTVGPCDIRQVEAGPDDRFHPALGHQCECPIDLGVAMASESYDEIQVGDRASLTRVVTDEMVHDFAELSRP